MRAQSARVKPHPDWTTQKAQGSLEWFHNTKKSNLGETPLIDQSPGSIEFMRDMPGLKYYIVQAHHLTLWQKLKLLLGWDFLFTVSIDAGVLKTVITGVNNSPLTKFLHRVDSIRPRYTNI